MVKVGGYILGEFGNLIAGDSRSSPAVQFNLLHSKYHLCSVATRALLLSAYIKFVNLFPEIKSQIQDIFRQDSNIRSADAELQQRASEYLKLSVVASTDVLVLFSEYIMLHNNKASTSLLTMLFMIFKATVLEEMPPFPERDSSILTILKKKKPGRVIEPLDVQGNREDSAAASVAHMIEGALDSGHGHNKQMNGQTDLLVDVLGDMYSSSQSSGASATQNSAVHANAAASQKLVDPAEYLRKLVWKHNGVLFENDLLQIGVKAEYRLNLARMTLFFGNKTAFHMKVRNLNYVI